MQLTALIAFVDGVAAQDLQSINVLNDGFTAALNSGDSSRIAAQYAENAVLMPPSDRMVTGRGGIERYWGRMARTIKDTKLTAIDVVTASDSKQAKSALMQREAQIRAAALSSASL